MRGQCTPADQCIAQVAPTAQSCGPTLPHVPAPNPPRVSCSPYIHVPATGPHWPQPGQGPADPKCYLCTFPSRRAAGLGPAADSIFYTWGCWGGWAEASARVESLPWIQRTVQPVFSPVISARLCPGSCQTQGGPPRFPRLLSPHRSGWNMISSRALVPSIVWVETTRDDSHKSCFFRRTREKKKPGCGVKAACCAKSIPAGFAKPSLVSCNPAL